MGVFVLMYVLLAVYCFWFIACSVLLAIYCLLSFDARKVFYL